LKRLLKYIGAYQTNLVFSILFYAPFFQILFNREPVAVARPDSAMQIGEWIKYFGAELIQNNDKQTALLYVCIAIVIVFFFKNLFRYLSSYMPMAFYDRNKTGDLLARMSYDTLEIEWSIMSFLEVLFKSPLIIIGSLFFMIYISPLCIQKIKTTIW